MTWCWETIKMPNAARGSPQSNPPRRQNRSCDPCRISKRRCLVPASEPGNGHVSCTNCARLGHECTFEFARSQSARARKKFNVQKSPVANDAAWAFGPALPNYTNMTDHDMLSFQGDMGVGAGFTESWPQMPSSFFDSFLSDVGLTPNLLEVEIPQGNRSWNDSCADETTEPDNHLSTLSQTQEEISSSPPTLTNRLLLLLNSSLTSKVIEDRLAKVYNVIVSSNSLRWLRHVPNSPSETQLDGSQGSSLPLTRTSNVEPQPTMLEETLCPIGPIRTISTTISEKSAKVAGPCAVSTHGDIKLLGAVRFLDHFGGLYGNNLSRFAQKASDTALKDALKVYAMQWLPVEGDGQATATLSVSNDGGTLPILDLYHESWLRAKTSLTNASGIRSFRIFYATLLFDACTAPEGSQHWNEEISSILDHAYSSLHSLSPLVRRHIQTLGPTSAYSSPLESSLESMEFFGYIRDTVSSLLGNRRCKMPEGSVKGRLGDG